MKDRLLRQRGFTIVDLMITIAISAILITVIFSVYDWHGKVYNYQQAVVRVSTASRTALETMQTYVGQSDSVLSSASVNGTNYTTSSTTLVTQLPSIDSSSHYIESEYDKVAFYSSGTNLFMQLEAGSLSSRQSVNKKLSDSLYSLSFTYNTTTPQNATQVTVNVNNRMTVKAQTVSSNLEQIIYLLNND